MARLRAHRQSEQSGDPDWPAYRLADRATMVFDVQSRVVADFRGDERTLLAGLKPPTN